MPSNTTSSAAAKLTACQALENTIKKITNQLTIMEGRLDILLNDANSDLSEIQTARNELSHLNKDLLKQKDEQRKQGCTPTGTPEILLDNQSLLSTSSVRRKDSRALDVIQMPIASVSTTLQTSKS